MNDMTHRAPVDLPQLRTLLLTDLCDSTELVERLGDVSAAALFREHDRLVLELQQRWRGRLIDRSDGLLLLFERPIDGLGFALDYVRGLRTLGEKRSVELKARAGLHVGEVLTWRNSTEAVQVGAKPLEVEGLAKPMAARLMAVARPGQILLSAVAEPLAHRAARELGERGQHLLWKSHGRWRFKGVPDSQQIYEVGEPGIAPLRMPPNSPKAWRDIPLWRRPAALAAEVALIGAIGFGAWFITRPAPAIAFNQRDWVVVADLRNLTGQAVLDDSLEQAFRISLEQSRYVNVLSDMKARETLARMRKSSDIVLDRAVASEVALRDGARAVILPVVAEVGGKVRVSAEVVDPHTQATVYSESSDGNGVGSALESIDKVTAGLREKLGEAVKSIERDSMPLPMVTTSNLDALRAYALAQKAYSQGGFNDADRLYRRATELDAQFALAWVGQTRVLYSMEHRQAAAKPMTRAWALKEHLAPREAMYLEAWVAELEHPVEALEKWQELARMYPDFMPAQGNAATGLYKLNRFADALPYARQATVPQYDLSAIGYDTLGRVLLATEDYPGAAKAFDAALSKGNNATMRRRIAVDAARRNFDGVKGAEARLSTTSPFSFIERVSVSIDQAQWSQALAESEKASSLVDGEQLFVRRAMLAQKSVALWLSGDVKGARVLARSIAEQSLAAIGNSADGRALDDVGLALTASLLSVRFGDRDLAPGVVARLEALKESRDPVAQELLVLLKAQEQRLDGRPGNAVKLLEPLLTGRERYQTRVVLMEAYAADGQLDKALEQAHWLQKRRGLAYSELGYGQTLQALNVADSQLAFLREAELLSSAGRAAESKEALQAFDRYWPAGQLADHLRKRRSKLDASS